jgi:HEPN domain-containing protein
MNPLTREWVEKAEGDFTIAGREMRARKAPIYDAICFHAQQCAEKYIKAFLHEHDQRIPKTHHFADLLPLLLKIDSTFELLRADLDMLEDYGVDFRYPGASATKEDAKLAYRAVGAVRLFARQKLDLP